jgi:hypothetical protein
MLTFARIVQADFSQMNAPWSRGCNDNDLGYPRTVTIARMFPRHSMATTRPVAEGVLGVLPGAGILQSARRRAGQTEGVIEFPIGEESSVTGDGGSMELQLNTAVEIDP